MTAERNEVGALMKALLETAEEMKYFGLLDRAAYGKIVARHPDHDSN
jgi:hypothetical protein